MIVVLLGPPGAGKGTQAKNIIEKYGLKHISTGEIFRRNIAEGTSLGKRAKGYIDNGLLVPDELTISLVEDTINNENFEKGFLMDGFPRTIVQADAFFDMLEQRAQRLNHVININVPEKELIKRLSGRRVCSGCGASFHMVFNPPKNDTICDYCSTKLTQRVDDSESSVINRLSIYKEQTQPLIDYYQERKLIRAVDGNKNVANVFEDICNMLGAKTNDLY